MQHIDTLDNGLTVVIEEMPHVESVAYELQIPGGIVCDPEDKLGGCLVLAELTSRGAGTLSSRSLSEAFEENGIRHGESCGFDRYLYRGALFAKNLPQALRLVSLMVQQPALPQSEIENIRSVLLQDLSALNDHPARRAFVELSSKYYPAPYSRCGMGSTEGLMAVDSESLRAMWKYQFAPEGAVLSLAGALKRDDVLKTVEANFAEWQGRAEKLPPFGKINRPAAHHIEHDSAQLQIVMAFPSAKFTDPHYYATKLAAGMLSGGMFGRLFIEVREKRGLCYSVYARHSATNDYGTMQAYAGTTPERAHETLQVMLDVFHALKGSATEEELARAKANLKASLVIGEESSASRAASNAGDWWLMKRVRTLDEILSKIDSISRAEVDAALEAFPARGITLLTLGSRDLTEVYNDNL
ncbi:MAG: insulinase family protein [Deltaproteobacteria bacterium]|nr:insulinase family protein [Deltaproteobacteria bacterium]